LSEAQRDLVQFIQDAAMQRVVPMLGQVHICTHGHPGDKESHNET
jgi:hypothetical protein